MHKIVQGYGPKSDLIIIGEAPGENELETGIPFVGPTGKEVEYHCEKAGFKINQVYRDNVFQFRLPDNDSKEKLKVVRENMQEAQQRLAKTIVTLDPNCILAVGGIALEALTGFKGINLHRGSLLKSITGHKVIPTIHPSAYLQSRGEGSTEYCYKFIVTLDFQKAYEESKTKDFNVPRRHLHVARNSLDVYRFLDSAPKTDPILVSLDIETITSIPVCIALAFNSYNAISIPIMDMGGNNSYHIYPHEMSEIWKLVIEFLNRKDVKFIGQNLKFDLEKLDAPLGWIDSLERDKVHADTMLMMGLCYPIFPKGLAFSTSVFTREPYYKDEGKEFNPARDKFDKLFLYNAKDAAVTYEVYQALYEELKDFGLLDFYFKYQNRLHDLYTYLEYCGVPIDENRRSELTKSYVADFRKQNEKLTKLCGKQVNVNSSKQVSGLLYEDLKLPLRQGADEATIVGLLGNHAKDQKEKEILNLILDLRKIRKTIGTYLEADLDYDGKMRTSYRIVGTETGRSSTSVLKSPVRPTQVGLAFQTMTAHGEFGGELRSIMIPGSGRIFISADESAAQVRIVAHLSDDKETLELVDKGDPHSTAAQWFFGGKLEDHSKKTDGTEPPTRFVGKTIRYAGLYGAQKRKIMQTVNTDAQKYRIDYSISEWKAGQLLEIYHEKTPKIRRVYYELIQEIARKDRILIGPFGRRIQYFDRNDDDLLRRMYACIPQGTDHDVLCHALLRVFDRIEWDPDLQLHVEAHDGCLLSCTEGREIEFGKIVKEEMEKPVDFSRCSIPRGELIIPCEIKVGYNYKDLKKVKL